MDLSFDARWRAKPGSSFARVLELLEGAATAAGLSFTEWTGGPCPAEVLWSPQPDPPPVRGPRLVLTIHDVNPLLPDGRPRWARLRREIGFRWRLHCVLGRAWRIATDSEDARERLARRLPAARERLRAVPLHPHPRFRPGEPSAAALAALRLRPGYVLYVGALRRHKNWERLVAAYAHLPLSRRRRHLLVLAGSLARARRRLRGLVARLRLEECVRAFDGLPDDVLPDLYRGARLFVFPSLMEGFGLPPLEAMACGTPVAASRRTSLPEVLDGAALYFDPEDPDAMGAVLERALRDGALRQRLQELGLRRAAQFGPERTGRALRAVLEEGKAARPGPLPG